MLKILKRAEWSKKIIIFLAALIICLFVTVALCAILGDSQPLTQFVIGTFALATIAVGFYYWKAKHENIRKYSKNLTKEEADTILKMYDKLLGGHDGDL